MKKVLIALILCATFIGCMSSCALRMLYPYDDAPHSSLTEQAGTRAPASPSEPPEAPTPPRDDPSQDAVYTNGPQIDLYYNASRNKLLSDFVRLNPSAVTVSDSSVLEIDNGQLIPLKVGEAYITCQYGNEYITYPVIINNGAERVYEGKIDGTATTRFTGYVGQSYELSTTTSSAASDIPLSELKIEITTGHSSIEGRDILRVEGNTIRLVGVGDVDIHISSRTNLQDEGVRIHVQARIEDSILAQAVDKWATVHGSMAQGYITCDELSRITDLTLSNLTVIDEKEWKTFFPSLERVTFDLTFGNSYNDTYTISSGTLAYCFVGSPNETYGFSISVEKRGVLDLTLKNLDLRSRGIALDCSAVDETNILCEGFVILHGADASDASNGCYGIYARALKLELALDSTVDIKGGDGAPGNADSIQIGASALKASKASFITNSNSDHVARLSISGGRGGNGKDLGTHGGVGGIGIEADDLTFEGYLECVVYGGRGGDGINGAPGSDGADAYFVNKGTKDAVVHNPENGTSGHSGGNGGSGGFAHTCRTISVDVNSSVTFCEGSGGNGGRGGNGGNGGLATDGYYGDIHIMFVGGVYFWGMTYGGSGGDGGSGGNGGERAVSVYSNVTGHITIIDGTFGSGGDGGNGGDGRNGGYAGSGSVPTGTIAITESGTKATGGAGGNGGNGGNGGSGSIPGQGGSRGSKGIGGAGSYLIFDRAWPLKTLEWYGDAGSDGIDGNNGGPGNIRT